MAAERIAQARKAELAAIPYERVETTGRDALATWERLRKEGRGYPVVVGGDEELCRVGEQLGIEDKTSPAEVVARAAALQHPADLRALRAKEDVQSAAAIREMLAGPDLGLINEIDVGRDGKAVRLSPADVRRRLQAQLTAAEPPLGDWPVTPPGSAGLSVTSGIDGQPLDKVHILLLPTTEGAAVPAFLRWGGWNACPPPEYHVAALRSWHERYGAELIGITGDVINLRVARRPRTRDEALALAHEQFLYCEDLILQGTEAFAPHAASLMASDWWFFWWE